MHTCGPSCRLSLAHAACASGHGFDPSSHSLCDSSHAEQSASPAIQRFMAAVPKAELHIHLEGTLEPEMMMDLAGRRLTGYMGTYPTVTE